MAVKEFPDGIPVNYTSRREVFYASIYRSGIYPLNFENKTISSDEEFAAAVSSIDNVMISVKNYDTSEEYQLGASIFFRRSESPIFELTLFGNTGTAFDTGKTQPIQIYVYAKFD